MSAVTITPGKVFGSNDAVSVANLNLLGSPTAVIPPNSITSAELDIDEVSSQLVLNSARNLFRNAGLSRLATAHALSSGNRVAAPAQGWFWRHTGTAAVTLTHDLTTLFADGPQASLVFTGASGTSTAGTVIGQSFGAEDIRDIRGGDLTVSFYVKNSTGASITPYLQVYTWDAAGTAAAVTQVESVAMTAVAANSTWTRVSATVDASLWSGGSALNGVDFFLYTDAALTNASYTLSYSRPQLELGATATTWEPALFRPVGKKIHRSSTPPSASFGVRQGYLQGDLWSVANTSVWECINAADTAAVWALIASSTGHTSMQVLTSGTDATYTPGTGTRAMRAQVWGAGGGGGGSSATASNVGYAMSGGGGGYSEALITDMTQVFKYTIGAGGTGGASGANAGTAGGASTFFGGVAGATSLAVGGGGGLGAAGTAGTTAAITGRGGAGGAGTVGSLNLTGSTGGSSGRISGTVPLLPSMPGHAPFLGGGHQANENADAPNALTYGAGGAGALVSSAAARSGGNGGGGLIIVTEYY